MKEDIQKFNEAWNNFIIAIAKVLYIDRLVIWLSDKLENEPKK